MKLVKGQLVILTYFLEGENADWEYGVVEHVYDNNTHITREDGSRCMHVIKDESSVKEYHDLLGEQPSKMYITPLTANGNPVIAKKSIFGKYKFEPKN